MAVGNEVAQFGVASHPEEASSLAKTGRFLRVFRNRRSKIAAPIAEKQTCLFASLADKWSACLIQMPAMAHKTNRLIVTTTAHPDDASLQLRAHQRFDQ